MSKFFLILLTSLSITCFAQKENFVEKNFEIASFEAAAHQRLMETEGTGGATDNYDVKYYRCEWEIDPAVRYIKGRVTTYFKMVNPSASIVFDLMSSLIVDSIKQRNQSLTFSQANNTINVNFAGTISAGATDSVSIYYRGVPANTGFGSFITSSHAGIPVAWSLSEPYGSRDWWPCKNNLGDKADSLDVYITHANTYRAASNGLLQSETPVAGGKVTTWWKHRYPITSYLICFAVTNYTVFNNSVQLGTVNLPMQTHCYPESQPVFQTNTQNVLDALKLFHNAFGDYPFIKEKYGHVQFGWGGGMEHQTATFIVNTGESLMAHELAHQWYGDKVTCGSWEDIWLNEGFATFLAAFYMEDKYPANIITNRRNVINSITSVAGGTLKVYDTTNVGLIFSSRLSYNKGSALLQMLRFMLGDAVFFSGMKKYHNDVRYGYAYARTEDFKKIMEAESGKDLTRFFVQWFEKEGYPSYNVQWSQFGSGAVKIKMDQTTSVPASVSFFAMPVPLLFKNATQEKLVIVDNTTNGEMFTKQIGFIADTVIIDPEYRLISRNNKSSKIAVTPTGAGIVSIFPNPVQSPLSLILEDFSAAVADVVIYNAAGQVVYKKNVALINGSEMLTLPSEKWSRGIYIVSITVGGKKIIRRIIK